MNLNKKDELLLLKTSEIKISLRRILKFAYYKVYVTKFKLTLFVFRIINENRKTR